MKKCFILAQGMLLAVLGSSDLMAAGYTDADGLNFELNEALRTASFVGIHPEFAASLESLVIPATVEAAGNVYDVTDLAENCCYNNRVIKTVALGDNVRTIGKSAFNSCTSLTGIEFGEAVTGIGSLSFYGCASLKEVSLPESLRDIGEFAFFYDSSLRTVYIPASVTSIGASPFGDCPALERIEVASDNPNYTSQDGVLYTKDMSRLINYPIGDGKESFTLPPYVAVIGSNSMRNNTVMTSVTLNPALVTIEEGAFNYCVLTSVHLPASLKDIGSQAFAGNPDLKEFTVDPANPYYTAKEGMLFTKDMRRLLIGVSREEVAIPDGVEEICEGAFYRFPEIKKLTLSPSLKTIGRSAFSTCKNLSEIEFSTGLETIGLQAFYQCTALKALALPSSLRFIDQAGFGVCTGLQRLEIAEGLESVGESAFQACSSLRKAVLPSTLTEVGSAMFYGCIKMEACVIPEGVASIGSSAFSSCQALRSVELPSTLENIGNYAFNSAGLTELSLNEGLYMIGDGAFAFCRFPEVTLPSTLMSIGSESFSWNSVLKEFRFGTGLRTMAAYALAKCDNLKTVECNEGLQSIGACAFQACEALETISLPSTLESVGAYLLINTPALRKLTCAAAEPPATDGSFYNEDYDGYPVVTLEVPRGSLDKYESAEVWREFVNKEGSDLGVADMKMPEPEVVEIYDINGLHQPAGRPGIQLLRLSDGTVRKVLRQ